MPKDDSQEVMETNTADSIPFEAFARFERITTKEPLLYCEPPAWAAAAHAIVAEDTVHYLWAEKKAEKKDEKGKEIEVRHTSRIPNRREKIVDLFANGAGNFGATRWDALNGLTEYVNHHNNIGKIDKQGRQAAERRLVSTLMGGPQDQLMQRGLNLLVDTKKFEKVAQTV